MLKLRLSPQAVIDLEDIYEFTFQTWGMSQADKYQDELYSTMQSISKNPSIGSLYYFKEGDYRKININRHIIFYRQYRNECIIVRILHERMNLKTRLDGA